jgi:hypothetical protein
MAAQLPRSMAVDSYRRRPPTAIESSSMQHDVCEQPMSAAAVDDAAAAEAAGASGAATSPRPEQFLAWQTRRQTQTARPEPIRSKSDSDWESPRDRDR